ncbi:hypothetical protein Q3G72_017690 [Acer saccharum]|nr:hypothetical protein Q3G72_017690 [Acer saccharum]
MGVEDKTVVVKKRGSLTAYDSDGLTPRDDVLYWMGGSSNVNGVAQCVGDLSFNECQDCLDTWRSNLH